MPAAGAESLSTLRNNGMETVLFVRDSPSGRPALRRNHRMRRS
jgi:hypothetical protein